jgi:hypothetical protein
MQSPNTITMLAARERVADHFRARTREAGKRIRTPKAPADTRFLHGMVVVLVAMAALVGGLVAAPSASAHDVTLRFDVKSVSDRVSKGTVAGPIKGSLRAEVRGRRPLARQARVTMDWKVRAGEHSFTARLRGSVNHRTRRAAMDGHIVSGFMAGAAVHLRGRLANPRTGRLVGTLALSPHAQRAAARTAADVCGHPCAVVSVVRYGQGLVRAKTSDGGGGIQCGTQCMDNFSTFDPEIVLVADGGFVSWKDCPVPAGNRCTIPVDGKSHCVHAFFTADQSAPPSAGRCPVAVPTPPQVPADVTAPETRIGAGPVRTTGRRIALFRFSANEGVSSFRCKLDAGAWTRCGSPKRYRGLEAGRHVFRVAAVDAAGNRDASPAVRRWRVAR